MHACLRARQGVYQTGGEKAGVAFWNFVQVAKNAGEIFDVSSKPSKMLQ